MAKIFLTIPLQPVAASRPRVPRFGKPYYVGKYEQFRKDFAQWVLTLGRVSKLEGAISVDWYKFSIQMPKSWSKKKKALMVDQPHIVKPDKNNLEKAVEDGLSGVFFQDDCQVWRSGEITKIWAYEGRIDLELSNNQTKTCR